ncbi:MAG TPA: hypothetical protein VMJ10_31565 [Kofleriaceae bacterium]|nr:hypothetical protein [Kofleriaceae bacterium]
MRAFVLVVACGCAAAPPPRTLPPVVSIGCLDVSVTRVHDHTGRGPRLEWKLSNTCDHAVPVDLGNARVLAFGPRFARTVLAPVNRHDAFAPGWLDAGETAFVRISYLPATFDRDVAIEVELDAFSAMSARPVMLAVVPEPLPHQQDPSTSAPDATDLTDY